MIIANDINDTPVVETKDETKYCANCGAALIEDTHFECLDNYLQAKYFDGENDNLFCSKDCFCEALSLEEIEEGENYE